MKLIPGLSWFASLRSKRPSPGAEPDHGDMGTAFGLDAIQSLFHEPGAEGGARAAADTPRAWEHRLTRRSSL